MHQVVQKTKGRVSLIISAVALILLITYAAIAIQAVADTKHREDEAGGLVFGISSAVLFLVAFILEFREKSVITSGMLISGGVIMGSLSLAREALVESGIANITESFANAASVGYIIMGLGILHLMKAREGSN